MKNRRTRFSNWVERAYAVSGKRLAIALGVGSLATFSLTFGMVAIAYYSGAMTPLTSENLWVDPRTVIVPLYDSTDGNEPIGYVMDQGERRIICRLDKTLTAYTCTTEEHRR